MSEGEDAATSLGDSTPDGHLNASLVQVLPLLAVVHRSGATPAQAEWPNAVRSFCGATPRTWVQVPERTAPRESLAVVKPPAGVPIDTYASPPETASATASPDRLTLCHFFPPSVVCHRPGLNSQPSLEFANRTVDTAVAGDVVNGGTSWTFGAVTLAQVAPPLAVVSSSALHGSRLQDRAPRA